MPTLFSFQDQRHFTETCSTCYQPSSVDSRGFRAPVTRSVFRCEALRSRRRPTSLLFVLLPSSLSAFPSLHLQLISSSCLDYPAHQVYRQHSREALPTRRSQGRGGQPVRREMAPVPVALGYRGGAGLQREHLLSHSFRQLFMKLILLFPSFRSVSETRSETGLNSSRKSKRLAQPSTTRTANDPSESASSTTLWSRARSTPNTTPGNETSSLGTESSSERRCETFTLRS